MSNAAISCRGGSFTQAIRMADRNRTTNTVVPHSVTATR